MYGDAKGAPYEFPSITAIVRRNGGEITDDSQLLLATTRSSLYSN